MSGPYHFIKQGRLYVQPVSMGAEVPYLVQPITKPREFSLWVRGHIEEPAFQLDNARMPPSMFQEIRNDLVRYSPVEVSRSAFARSNHAYTGVIDSKGKPYYFALDSRGISVREAKTNDEQVWKTFDRLADQERAMAANERRTAATSEMKQIARELSEPQLVIKGDFDWKRKTKERVAHVDGKPLKKKPCCEACAKGFPAEQLLEKADGHTGTMVSLHIPSDIAQQIALPGGETAESMHITLAYLGKDLTEEQKSAALCAVRRFAQQAGPIRALLGGVGRFSASHTSEGNDVVYLSVDSPDITLLRPKLLEELAADGIVPSNAHGFVPHVTLMYVPTTAKTPIKRFPPVAVTFPDVSLTVADNKMTIPFTQPLLIIKALHPAVAWMAQSLKAGKTIKHENGTIARQRKVTGTDSHEYVVTSPHGARTYHATAEEAGAKAHEHTKKSLAKALPKKAKEEKVKKTPNKGASKKQVGAGGKTRYTYPKEKLAAGGKGKGKPMQQQPLLVVRHDDSKNANPSEFANQLGVSVRTLKRCAKRLGRDGFSKFMRSRLKRFNAKHRIDPDYWGVMHANLMGVSA